MVKTELDKRNRKLTKKEIVEHNAKIASAKESSMLNEYLNLQKEYRDNVLARLFTGAQLKEIRKQLDEKNITIQWRGIPCPEDILVMEHDILQTQYFDLQANENNVHAKLKLHGVTTKQLEALVKTGKLLKTLPKQLKDKASYIS